MEQNITIEDVTQGVTLLNDINTDKPLALLNGTYLTALRKDVYVYSRTESKVDSFIEKLQLLLSNVSFLRSNSSKYAVEKSDITICATTSASPVISSEVDDYIYITTVCEGVQV